MKKHKIVSVFVVCLLLAISIYGLNPTSAKYTDTFRSNDVALDVTVLENPENNFVVLSNSPNFDPNGTWIVPEGIPVDFSTSIPVRLLMGERYMYRYSMNPINISQTNYLVFDCYLPAGFSNNTLKAGASNWDAKIELSSDNKNDTAAEIDYDLFAALNLSEPVTVGQWHKVIIRLDDFRKNGAAFDATNVSFLGIYWYYENPTGTITTFEGYIKNLRFVKYAELAPGIYPTGNTQVWG